MKIKANYAFMPVTTTTLEVLVQVTEPYALQVETYEITLAEFLGYPGEGKDRGELILKNKIKQNLGLSPQSTDVDVELIESYILVPILPEQPEHKE